MDIAQFVSSLQQSPVFVILFYTYTATLKGFSLWRAAKNSSKYWFIFILIVNLLGIPEILYLLYFSKKQFKFPSIKLLKKETPRK